MASSSTGDQLPQVAYIDAGGRMESGEAPKFVDFDQTGKEVAHHGFDNAPQLVKGEEDREGEEARPGATVCGLRPKWFWTVVILAIVVIGAAVGGGVGGGIAASRKDDAEPAASPRYVVVYRSHLRSQDILTLTRAHSVSPTTSESASAASASATGSPTSDADFTFQWFEAARYQGEASDLLRQAGRVELGFNASSYVWEPNGTPCCVTLCQQSVWVGWWCQARQQPDASSDFDNVDIGCSGNESEDTSRATCVTRPP